MSSTVSTRRRRPVKSAAAAAKSDVTNGNTAFFDRHSAAAAAALQRWNGALPAGESTVVTLYGVMEDERSEREEEEKKLNSLTPMSPDTHTLNGAGSFSTTQSARVDLFFSMVRGIPSERVHALCTDSWKESPEHTVQLMLHSRDARSGKGEKLISLYALLWLRRHKPATYLHNLMTYLSFAYFKDLLQLAVLIKSEGLEPLGTKVREDLQRKVMRQEEKKKNNKSSHQTHVVEVEQELLEIELFAEFLKMDYEALEAHKKRVAIINRRREGDLRAANAKAESDAAVVDDESKPAEPECEESKETELKEDDSDDSNAAAADDDWETVGAALPAGVDAAAAACVAPSAAVSSSSSSSSPPPAAVKKSNSRIPHLQLSLAAKWAPSEGSSFDKKHHLAKRLARLLFPNDRQCFRRYRTFLSEARTHLGIVEKMMSSKTYETIDFEKIPSKAHQLLKKALVKHCSERYKNYLENLKQGTVKINTAGLMPHELASAYITGKISTVDGTIEGAWRTLLDKLRSKCSSGSGGLKSALAVVDVSGSMTCNHGIPMNVAISLGLIISELSQGPFHGRCITFSEQPQWFSIPRETTLFAQVQSMKSMAWGMSTNLQAVFEMILDCALKHKIHQTDLPETLFIFSDMQFNQACHGDTFMAGSIYQHVKERFIKHGYQIPQIVFWNLNGSNHSDFPVDVTTPGVALIGGYSAELLKAFLDGERLDPMSIMLSTIQGYKVAIEERER